ncbi:MAG: hypothetical protein U0L88_14340, partial [Acutalibacteraceae bacterium]|nr:hypothetical protein [Acutalibacteraceae bacterium]
IYTWLYKCGVGRDDEAEEIPYTEKCVYFIDNVDRLSHEESEVFIRSINAFVRDVAVQFSLAAPLSNAIGTAAAGKPVAK